MIQKILVLTTVASLGVAFLFNSAWAQDADTGSRVRAACASMRYSASEEAYYTCIRSLGQVYGRYGTAPSGDPYGGVSAPGQD